MAIADLLAVCEAVTPAAVRFVRSRACRYCSSTRSFLIHILSRGNPNAKIVASHNSLGISIKQALH